ncbi:MAG TPA: alanine racemase C-terminal domain-containing protein, partial [Pseudolabrys sp.]|nr:alanine racemase C-terminal domain-containing protein [Pseudolabrys sp.]
VRPGIALYGINPTPGRANPMQPVVTLQARILDVRHVRRGETVGYGATWTARKNARIAVAAVGYADGIPRALSGSDSAPGGEAVVAGKRCPIAGRISMDLTAVDISEVPDGAGRRGELVTVIGDGISIDRVADLAGTIGYEILTRLGRRFHRVYVNAAE